jgi:cell division protein FtsB
MKDRTEKTHRQHLRRPVRRTSLFVAALSLLLCAGAITSLAFVSNRNASLSESIDTVNRDIAGLENRNDALSRSPRR